LQIEQGQMSIPISTSHEAPNSTFPESPTWSIVPARIDGGNCS
jgi:hypothetical protein